ncbi:hypothetical protein C6503_13540 [Candidatus Poribacteria bacterium]|nr:MAG: hypothetical protein C6503_13540 [Candidatus Poribacteria bacterium]
MSEKPQGFDEYTPSRLEWLVVMLNSMVQYLNTVPGEPIVCAFTPASDGNTIVMHIRYFADIPPEQVKRIETDSRTFALDLAKSYNWDSWINIQTQLTPIERPPKK